MFAHVKIFFNEVQSCVVKVKTEWESCVCHGVPTDWPIKDGVWKVIKHLFRVWRIKVSDEQAGRKGLSGDDDEFNGRSLRPEGSGQRLGSCIVCQTTDTNTIHLHYLKPRLGRGEGGEDLC